MCVCRTFENASVFFDGNFEENILSTPVMRYAGMRCAASSWRAIHALSILENVKMKSLISARNHNFVNAYAIFDGKFEENMIFTPSMRFSGIFYLIVASYPSMVNCPENVQIVSPKYI